jgi:hypothetical protein
MNGHRELGRPVGKTLRPVVNTTRQAVIAKAHDRPVWPNDDASNLRGGVLRPTRDESRHGKESLIPVVYFGHAPRLLLAKSTTTSMIVPAHPTL